jgi:predicted TPR repeat methyltransferase
MRPRFDKAYYDRFYRNPETRATTPAAARRQAEFIAAYLRYLEVPVRRFLDMGCGTGVLLRALARQFPRARFEGVEFSEYLCGNYGWTQGSVVDYRPRTPFDLVVCNDVLGYLDDADCVAALDNLAAATHGALYLGVLTREDLALCDRARTDDSQVARPVAWYRERLEDRFLNVGGGLYLRQPVDVTIWHLERA